MRVGSNKMTILNLAGTLSETLSNYFNTNSIELVTSDFENSDVTHILCRDIQSFSEIVSTYATVRNDIKIISLTQVQNLQHFVASNGKLIFDETWLKTPIGAFILDKFFQDNENHSVNREQPSFQEKGSFNIANLFSTGEYLDRMVHAAFQDGISALSVKTYFDHLIMYLAGLKRIGKLGLPVEVIFGTYKDVFSVQIQFFSQGLRSKDLILSLSSDYSNSEENLLNIAVQSADFLDFTLLSEVQKSVITGLWTKSDKIKTRNRGFLVSELSSTASLSQYPSSQASPFQTGESDLSDMTDKILLPANQEMEGVSDFNSSLESFEIGDIDENRKQINSSRPQKVSASNFQGLENEFASNSSELNSKKQIRSEGSQNIQGTPIENQIQKVPNKKLFAEDDEILDSTQSNLDEMEDGSTLKEGDFELDENFNIVKSLKKLKTSEKDDASLVKGKKEQVDYTQRISENQLYSDQETTTVKGHKPSPESAQFLKDSKAKSFEDELTLVRGSKEQLESSRKVKGKIPLSLEDEYRMVKGTKDEQEESFNVKGSQDEKIEPQIIKGTKPKAGELLKLKSFEDQLPDETKQKINNYLSLKKKKSEDLVDDDIDAIGDPQLKKLVTSAKEEILIVQPHVIVEAAKPSLDLRQKELEGEVNSLTSENEQLKLKMKTLLSEVRILKESRTQMSEIHKKAVKAAEEAVESPSLVDENAPLKDQLLKKLKGNSSFSEQDLQKLSGLLEKEGKLYRESKELEVRTKKLQIELSQKESFFVQELEKLQRHLKAKDLVVLKTKEGLSKLVQKKDEDLSILNMKLAQANKTIANNNAQGQALQIRDLEKQISNHQKMIEIYKNKAIQKASPDLEDEATKEELRRQQIVSNQLKNQLELTRKEFNKLQENSSRDASVISILKSDKNKLEQLLKKASQETKKEEIVTNNSQQVVDQEMKKIKGLNEFYETQLRDSQSRQRALEAKLQEVVRNQKKEAISEDNGSKVKTSQLEESVKKLSRDLLESRNQMADLKKEATKLRQEKTALQNLLENTKKSGEKSKGAAPKKMGSGGKAA